MGLQDIYDNLYKTTDYNEPVITGNDDKYQLILPFLMDADAKTAVDLGCGRGYYLRKMLQLGIKAWGIEFSAECHKMYLQGLPASQEDIKSACLTGKKVDLAVCMDVLEHIPEEELYDTLQAVCKVANYAVFGIANHEEKLDGVDIHCTNHGRFWWQNYLHQFYDSVEMVGTKYGDRFFIAVCKRSDRVLIVHPSRKRPQQALDAFHQHVKAMGNRDTKVKYVFSLDVDDRSEYTTDLATENVEVGFYYGHNNGCVQATNRAYHKEWLMWCDYVILTSDDMELDQEWDKKLSSSFKACGFDNCIKTKQPGGRDDVLTLQIGGWKFFLDYGTFFWPEYRSIWADSDLTEWAKLNDRWIVDDSIVCLHKHPYLKRPDSLPLDEVYEAENNPERHAQGVELFERRKADGFPAFVETSFTVASNVEIVYPFQFGEEDIKQAVIRLCCSIESLKGQHCSFVVMNASKDCIIRELLDKTDVDILYIHKPYMVKGHKTKIHNYTIKHWCFGDYIFQSDIDIVYPEDVVLRLMTKMEREKLCRVLIMCQYLNTTIPTGSYDRLYADKDRIRSDSPYPSTGLGIIDRRKFLYIGGYDEAFVGWGPEDRELNNRMEQLGKVEVMEDILSFHLYHEINRLNYENNHQYGYTRIGEVSDRIKSGIPEDDKMYLLCCNNWSIGEWRTETKTKATSSQGATLALNMIVGPNDGPVLERALKSLDLSVFDEIVIVSTTNDEDIPKVCAQFNITPLQFTWADNFSEARNHALQNTTADFVFWQDCDDVLTEQKKGALARLKKLLAAQQYNVYFFLYDLGDGRLLWRERVFRRRGTSWRFPVHEQLIIAGREKLLMVNGAVLLHLPQKSAEFSIARNTAILETCKDQSFHLKAMYAFEKLNAATRDKNFYERERAMSLLRELTDERYAVLIQLVHVYKRLAMCELYPTGDPNKLTKNMEAVYKAEEYCRVGMHISPDCAEFSTMMGDIHLLFKKDTAAAETYYQSSLQKKMPANGTHYSIFYSEIPLLRLSHIACLNKAYELALHYNRMSLELKPNDKQLLENQKNLLDFLIKKCQSPTSEQTSEKQ